MRFPPIPDDAMTPAQHAVADEIRAGPRGVVRGPFLPLLHSPALAAHVQRLGAQVRFGSSLPKPLVEIATLIAARHMDCAHVWASHRKQALAAGVAPELIADIAARRATAHASGEEASVIAFCRELLTANKVSDATFERIAARFGRQGALDLAATCGYYMLLATVLNTAEVVPAAGVTPFEA